MGSDDKAVITGFICRLCSRMNRFVVHIYGDEGVQMQLAQKINIYLPITVNPNDPLPKTVCVSCIESLEAQHELMEQFKLARQRFMQVAETDATQYCGRNHSPRPPEDRQSQHASSVIVSPSNVSRSWRLPSEDTVDLSARPSSETVMSTSPSPDQNNSSVPHLP